MTNYLMNEIINNNTSSHRIWRKVLYDKQSYPDNYIDNKKFLDNLNLSNPIDDTLISYNELLIGTSTILEQVSVVAIFIALYKYILFKYITVYGIITLDIITLIMNYFINKLFNIEVNKHYNSNYSISQSSLSFVIIGVCIRIAAPILQTLTSSFSDDTIYALAIVFSTIHLLFHDYAYVNCETDVFEGTLSLSAAMLTSILLASRLTDIDVVFGFVILAVICFSLFPIFARLLKKRSIILHLFGVISLYFTACLLLINLDKTLFAVYQVSVMLLFLCPILYKHMIRYKRSFRGPWDIATLQRITSS